MAQQSHFRFSRQACDQFSHTSISSSTTRRITPLLVLGASLIFLPLLASAKGGALLLRAPEVKTNQNSQTMALLEGYLNTNPVNIGGPVVAVADGMTLSAKSEDGSAFVEKGSSGTGQISTYIVKEGDTIGQIAQSFGVSVNTIRWANNLSGSTLKVGQELAILPITGVRHVVKSGDTLASIAKKYSAEQSDILGYNGLSADAKLAVGDEIIIPDGELAPTRAVPSTGSVQKFASGLKEVVGYYLRPVTGGIKTQGIHGHNGVDLASSYGAPILAAADGKVLISKSDGWNGGYGSYIVLEHGNGTQTVYGHLSVTLVSVGDTVTQGQVIGKMGNSGQVTGKTGIHVHFEIRGAKNPF
jgi:LysM repeat protein